MRKNLIVAFYLFEFIVVVLIIGCSLSKPQHNLFPLQELIISIGVLAVLLGFGICAFKIKINISERILIILVGILGIGLFIMGLVARNSQNSLHDYGVVYRNAIALSEGKSIDEDYFIAYSNNIMALLILSRVVALARLIWATDPYYLILLIGVLITIGAMASVCYLAFKASGSMMSSVLAVVFFALMLPVWVNSATLYTDNMTFGSAIIALALMVYGMERAGKSMGLFCQLLSSLVLAIGILIKITCIIPFIASVICVFLILKEKTKKFGLIWVCFFVLFFFLGSTLKNEFYLSDKVKNGKDPVIAWVGLGLVGEGSYAANEAYVDELHKLSTKEMKKDYSKAYILDNISEISNPWHYINKIRCNYASGYYGADDYIYVPEVGYENHILWKICHPYGTYYWRTSQLTFGYAMGIYIIYALGILVTIVNTIRKKEVSPVLLICDISFVGYFVFLMIWEANNRQLYNFLPIMVLGMILHIYQIYQMLSTGRVSKKEA